MQPGAWVPSSTARLQKAKAGQGTEVMSCGSSRRGPGLVRPVIDERNGEKQMKIMITILALIIVAIFQAPVSALAQRSLAYDSQGNFAGTAITRGSVGTAYDRNGNVEGQAVRRGNTVTYTKRDGSSVKFTFVNRGNTSFIFHNGHLDGKVIRERYTRAADRLARNAMVRTSNNVTDVVTKSSVR
jgi:hypothetical protein